MVFEHSELYGEDSKSRSHSILYLLKNKEKEIKF